MKKTLITVLSVSVLTLSAGAYYIFKPFQTAPQQGYTVTLPVEGWQAVIDGLAELPLKRSEQFKNAIIQQINTQIAQSQQPVKKDTTTKKH